MALLMTTYTNTVASLYISRLLCSPKLPALLTVNSERLTASYRHLPICLRKWKLDFMKPTHGLFAFARLDTSARDVQTARLFLDQLLGAGLKTSPGRLYRSKEGEFG